MADTRPLLDAHDIEDVAETLRQHRARAAAPGRPASCSGLPGDDECTWTYGDDVDFETHQAKMVGRMLYPRRQAKVCSTALVLRGPLVLLVERRDGLGWAPPGGRLDFGEPVPHGAVRETAEECGIVVGGGPVIGVIDWYDAGLSEHWTVWYVGCRYIDGSADVQVMEPTKHSAVKWVHLDALDSMKLVPSFVRLREESPNWHERVPQL